MESCRLAWYLPLSASSTKNRFTKFRPQDLRSAKHKQLQGIATLDPWRWACCKSQNVPDPNLRLQISLATIGYFGLWIPPEFHLQPSTLALLDLLAGYLLWFVLICSTTIMYTELPLTPTFCRVFPCQQLLWIHLDPSAPAGDWPGLLAPPLYLWAGHYAEYCLSADRRLAHESLLAVSCAVVMNISIYT